MDIQHIFYYKFAMKSFIKWFLGFVDAEGNFQVTAKPRIDKNGNITKYGIGYAFHLALSIRDESLVRYIQDMLQGLGKIYVYPHRDEVHYAITRKDQLLQFITLVMSEHSLLTHNQYKRFMNLKWVLEQAPASVMTKEDFDMLINNIAVTSPNPFDNHHEHINE